jgi:hypothetical protein
MVVVCSGADRATVARHVKSESSQAARVRQRSPSVFAGPPVAIRSRNLSSNGRDPFRSRQPVFSRCSHAAFPRKIQIFVPSTRNAIRSLGAQMKDLRPTGGPSANPLPLFRSRPSILLEDLSYLRQLQRKFHVAVLVVHHARKDANTTRPGQALRGSSEVHGWATPPLPEAAAQQRGPCCKPACARIVDRAHRPPFAIACA